MSEENTNSPEISETDSTVATATKKDSKQDKHEADLKKLKEAHLALVSEFVDSITSLINPDTAKYNLRLTKDGLFIKEEFLRTVLMAFQNWYKEKTSQTSFLSVVKTKKKFFGDEDLFQVYLIEGKNCLVGYLLQIDTANRRKSGLPYIDSRTLSAANFMHSRDPLLESFADQKLNLQPGASEIIVDLVDYKVKFSLAKVKEFQMLANNSPMILRRFKKIREAQRYVLIALIKILKASRKISNKKAHLIPVGTENFPADSFRSWYDWLFFIDRNLVVQECFELKGKNRASFVIGELKLLNERFSRKLRDMRVYKNPVSDIGEVRIGHNSYIVGGRALENIESFFPYYISQFGRNLRYSYADILNFFTKEFQSAYTVKPKEVSWLLKNGKVKAFEFRFNKKWLFLINNKRVVFAVIQVPGAYQEDHSKLVITDPINILGKGE